MFYYIELRIEAVNVGHLNLVRTVPWASAAMNVVFLIQSLVDYHCFLNYNTGELQVTSEVNIVPVSTGFTIVRCYSNKIYSKHLECTELCYAENVLTSHAQAQ